MSTFKASKISEIKTFNEIITDVENKGYPIFIISVLELKISINGTNPYSKA